MWKQEKAGPSRAFEHSAETETKENRQMTTIGSLRDLVVWVEAESEHYGDEAEAIANLIFEDRDCPPFGTDWAVFLESRSIEDAWTCLVDLGTP